MTDPVATLRARLENVKPIATGGFTARCPCTANHKHGDRHNSLKVDKGKDRQALIHCHTGCQPEQIVAALGLEMKDLFPAPAAATVGRNGHAPPKTVVATLRYDVGTVDGSARAMHVREEYSDGTKRMWWETPQGGRGLGGVKTADLELYGVGAIGDSEAVVVVEGEKCRDDAGELGVPFVATVTGASGTPSDEALRPLLGRAVSLWPDNDDAGRAHMDRIARRLREMGQRAEQISVVTWLEAPPGGDVGDWVAEGNDAHLLRDRLADVAQWREPEAMFRADPGAPPATIEDVVAVYRKWLYLPGGDEGPIYVALGAVAANLLASDPVWLLIVGPSSGGKTEIINPIAGLPYVHAAATLTEASLLSGTPKREKAQGSKGGLLREIGDFGILILKDFTSILSMNRDQRSALLAALREIFDGAWTRHVGVDGGRSLSWAGKLGVIGACTAAIDTHHSVMAVMGERFLLYRLPAIDPEKQAERALANAWHVKEMRAELTAAIRGLFAGFEADVDLPELGGEETRGLIMLASLVASARSAVERDNYKREIELVLDTEGPARLAQTLRRLYAGMLAIGTPPEVAWPLVCKTGIDCIPKLRRAALNILIPSDDWLTTTEIATAAGYPSITMRRALEDLAAHGVVYRESGGQGKADRWITSDLARLRLKTAFSKMSVLGNDTTLHNYLFTNPHRMYDDKLEKVNSPRNRAENGVDTESPVRSVHMSLGDDSETTHCWACTGRVPPSAERCPACGWLVCDCGACSAECAYGETLVGGES